MESEINALSQIYGELLISDSIVDSAVSVWNFDAQ